MNKYEIIKAIVDFDESKLEAASGNILEINSFLQAMMIFYQVSGVPNIEEGKKVRIAGDYLKMMRRIDPSMAEEYIFTNGELIAI